MADNKKTIVLTGVTRGLGRAMTEGFIERGHTVIGCGRSAESLEELRNEFDSPHRFDVVDISSDSEVREWAASVLEEIAGPDLLINNAAIINRNANLWELSDEEFSEIMAVNVNGTVNVLRHFVPGMVEANRGVIVNFSSGWGRSTSPEVASYCGTKWAIEGLTQALAQELPNGMAAVPLNPGIINTALLQSCFGSHAAGYPSAAKWAKRAVPFLLELSSRDNGRSLTVS